MSPVTDRRTARPINWPITATVFFAADVVGKKLRDVGRGHAVMARSSSRAKSRFEEKLALLLLTTAEGNRALIDEAIHVVADEGLSALHDVLDYIMQKRRQASGCPRH